MVIDVVTVEWGGRGKVELALVFFSSTACPVLSRACRWNSVIRYFIVCSLTLWPAGGGKGRRLPTTPMPHLGIFGVPAALNRVQPRQFSMLVDTQPEVARAQLDDMKISKTFHESGNSCGSGPGSG